MEAKPKVLHRHRPEPGRPFKRAYCGKPTKWAGPMLHWNPVIREESLWNYFWKLLENESLLRSVGALEGYDLVGYGAPNHCHCDILLILANDWTVTMALMQHISSKKITQRQWVHQKDTLTDIQISLVADFWKRLYPNTVNPGVYETSPD